MIHFYCSHIIWILTKVCCNSANIEALFCNKLIALLSQWSVLDAAQLDTYFFVAHKLDRGQCTKSYSGNYFAVSKYRLMFNNLHFFVSKKRTYLESYVDFMFDFIAKHDVQKLRCILCTHVLGYGSMKSSILKAYFTSCDFAHVHDDHKSLLAKRAQFYTARTLPKLRFCSKVKKD